MSKYRYVVPMVVALLWLGACQDPLDVKNVNNPSAGDVLATPADLRNWIRDTYNAWFRGGWAFDRLRPQMFTAGLENHSELANFNMGPRYLMPRGFIENSRGAPGAGESNSDFVQFHRAARSAALGLQKLRTITVGSPGLDAQARAFAWYSLGLANGYLSMVWDSAAIASPDDDPACVSLACLTPLVSYQQVNAAALENLDSAEAVANSAPTGAFPIPSTWLRQSANVSQADFIRLVRSHRAQIRAGMARTPAQRAAVDWAKVIADANAGITADFQISADPANNWNVQWPVNGFRAGSWHGMHMFMIGMADTSGEYQSWLNEPRNDKLQFVIQTPDRRFPRGATRPAQNSSPGTKAPPIQVVGTTASLSFVASPPQIARTTGSFVTDLWHAGDQVSVTGSAGNNRTYTVSAVSDLVLDLSPADTPTAEGPTANVTLAGPSVGLYFRNRPAGDDTPGDPLGSSMYDHYRFRAFFNANRIGPYPILTKAEIDLLAAEGYLRATPPDLENARLKINTTRVAAGLPAIPAGVTITDPVPGGTACVPRVPTWTGTAYQAVCGNILEALKWEKRMETAYTGYGNWYLDSRGWGDLPEGTPVDWPIPWEEADTRRKTFLAVWAGCGKVGTVESSGASTYGPAISCNP